MPHSTSRVNTTPDITPPYIHYMHRIQTDIAYGLACIQDMRANIDSSKHYYTHTWWVQKLRRCNTRCQNSTTHIALFACMRACSTFCVYSFCLLEGIVLIDSPEDGYNRIHTDPPNNKMHKQFESIAHCAAHT